MFLDSLWLTSNLTANTSFLNPRTASEITPVHAASPEDVDKAVKAARGALGHPSWRDLPASERGQLMTRLSQLIEQNRETLAANRGMR